MKIRHIESEKHFSWLKEYQNPSFELCGLQGEISAGLHIFWAVNLHPSLHLVLDIHNAEAET
jgi:hypothetical protein